MFIWVKKKWPWQEVAIFWHATNFRRNSDKQLESENFRQNRLWCL